MYMKKHSPTTNMDDVLNKKEALLYQQYLNEKYKREINKIEKSGTWKAGRISRFFANIRAKMFGRLPSRKMYEQVIIENNQLREQLLEQSASLQQKSLYHEDMLSLERMQLLRELKNSGQLYSHLNETLSSFEKYRTDMKETLVQIARLYMNEEPEIKAYMYEQILNILPTEDIPEFMIRIGIEKDVPLTSTASFRGSLSARMRQAQYFPRLPEWQLDDKKSAYSFVEQFKIKVPHTNNYSYDIASLPLQEGIVIKPVNGAGGRGVYIVHDDKWIIDVKESSDFQGFDELRSRMHRDLEIGAVAEDSWFIEEIIYENKQEKLAGRDLKFYTFYGKVGLILEIIRYPEMRYCWWDSNLNRISVGKYDEQLFIGEGVTKEELQMVEKLSEQIPAPFIRIDFLRSEYDLVFGEFTPKPGNYDEFNKEVDQRLGDDYLKAQVRLDMDLINGKQFERFNAYRKDLVIRS